MILFFSFSSHSNSPKVYVHVLIQQEQGRLVALSQNGLMQQWNALVISDIYICSVVLKSR